MSTRTKKAIVLALMAVVGCASGIYIAHNDPDTIAVVGMGLAGGTVSSFLSWWWVRTERVRHDGQGD